MNATLQAALEYASMGYRVFPILPGGKTPETIHGFYDATTDEEQIESWWEARPKSNVAIQTNGLLVLDVDGPKNPWLFQAEDRLSSFVSAPTQKTPRGGMQFFFRQPAGKQWRNTVGKLAPEVDTRANGGYVVVPPSVRNEGRYHWLPECGLVPPNDLLEPPAWLQDQLDLLHSGKRFTLHDQYDEREKIQLGRRNQTLTSLAGAYRRIGAEPSVIDAALQEVNRLRCEPPLEEEEVGRIARSVGRYEPDQFATIAAEMDEDETDIDTMEHPGAFPDDLLEAPGFLGELVRSAKASAHRPQPILALGAALACLAALTGRKITDTTGTQTNLYVIGVCASGGGKEQARRLVKDVLQLSGAERLIGPESWGSAAGLLAAVDKEPAVLFQVDEIGRYLRTLHNPSKAPHLYNIVTTLLRLFTSSGSLYVGEAYADLKKTRRIDWPHACLYGTTVPESLAAGLTRESLTDGFLARILVLESETPVPAKQEPNGMEIPKGLLEFSRRWNDFSPGLNLSRVNPQPRVVTYSEGALQVLQELDEVSDRERQRSDLSALWTRAGEKARKLALLYAASEKDEPAHVEEISVEAATWAARLAEYTTRRTLYLAEERVGDTELECRTKEVLRFVRSGGASGKTRNEVTRRFQALPKRLREEILETLVSSGQVRVETVTTRGRAKRVFRHPSSGLRHCHK